MKGAAASDVAGNEWRAISTPAAQVTTSNKRRRETPEAETKPEKRAPRSQRRTQQTPAEARRNPPRTRAQTRLQILQIANQARGQPSERPSLAASSPSPPRPRAQLTRKNLALLNKMADPERTSEETTEEDTTTTTTTSGDFRKRAYANGVLTTEFAKPPANLDAIQKRHAASRTSPSPSPDDYELYSHAVTYAPNGATVMFAASRHLLKEYDDDPGYQGAYNQAFTGFPDDAGFNRGLSPPQPDYVEGLRIREFHPVRLDEPHLDSAVLYKDKPGSLVLPHMAAEWNKTGKDMDKAELHSAYDGAALVYSRNQALAASSEGRPDPSAHAEVMTFTSDGGVVHFYAHYAEPSEEDPDVLEYHQYRYASERVNGSYADYKKGRRGIRNLQDHARANSMAIRDQLKAQNIQQRSGRLQPKAETPRGDKTVEEEGNGMQKVVDTVSHGKRKRPNSPEEPRRSLRRSRRKK